METGWDGVLLGDMINAKTSFKLLRHLGMVLIALPEPITTPFGVALVFASRYLSRRLEASLNKHLRETLKHYLAHFKRFGDDADGKSSAPGRARRQSEEHLLPWQYKDSHSFKANPRPLVWQSLRDTGDDVIHHTVDMKRLSWRYGIRDGSKVEPGDSDWGATSGSTEKLMHHNIDMQMLSRRYKADDSSKVESDWSDTSSTAEKVIHHTINMESLSRRYKGEDSIGADSNSACTSGTVKGVVHHAVNIKLLSQCYETDGVAPVKVRHHTINMASLLRRYGPAVGSTPALKAHHTRLELLNLNAYPTIRFPN